MKPPLLARWSLKTRMTLFTLALFLLGVWSLTFYVGRLLHADMTRLAGEQQFSTVSFVADEIHHQFESRIRALEKVAAHIGPFLLGRPQDLQQLLEERPALLDLFNAGLVVIGPDGVALADLPRTGRRGVNYADRDFVIGALQQGRSTIGRPVMGKTSKAPVIVIATPIRNAQGRMLGALLGTTDLNQANFLDIVANNRYGKTGGYLLVAPSQQLIVTGTDRRRIMEPVPADLLQRFAGGYEGSSVFVNPLGVEVLSSRKAIALADWYAVATLPTTEAFAPIRDMQRRMLLAALGLSLLAAALTWWMVRRQLAPMLGAMKAMATLSSTGQALHPLPISRQDEVGQFIGGVNRLLAVLGQRETALRIAAAAFESHQGVIVTDAAQVILRVNRAFSQITGYAASEVEGQTPRLLNSGHQDAHFYAAMWAELARTGAWQGEIWNRRKDGEIYPEWLSISAVHDDTGQVSHYVGTFSDISLRKAAEDKIQKLAFYDPLTGLPNRRLLMDRLAHALAASSRHPRKGALMFVDLDNFKIINDTLGHANGDLLLQVVAKRLLTCIREGDTVARLGGDEFVVMLADLSVNGLDAAKQAETVGANILTALNHTCKLGEHEYHITPSIGVTLFGGEPHETIDEPLKRADLAMYQAKNAGRNTLRFFDPRMQAAVTARVELERGLREALACQQFHLDYQAQMTESGRLMGAEVLVRWRHPQRGLVSPAEFIPLAEETGLILPLGQWVLTTACRQLAAWAGQPTLAHLTISVNVSACQFHQANFVAQVLAAIAHTGADPRRLKLELTESLVLSNLEDIIQKMNALKEVGVDFSLDDFGTGYSSLSYLKRLPLGQLKIDRSFVRDILVDANDAAIAKMVVALANSMGLTVIAEGVETAEQRNSLADLGCHAYQGYLFGRPLPIHEFETFARDTLEALSRNAMNTDAARPRARAETPT